MGVVRKLLGAVAVAGIGAAMVLMLGACVMLSGAGASLVVALNVVDHGIRASAGPFEETTLHVMVVNEASIGTSARGSAQRRRVADCLSVRVAGTNALADSPTFAERALPVTGTAQSVELGGFQPGIPYVVLAVASNTADPQSVPYVGYARLVLKTGSNRVNISLGNNPAVPLDDFWRWFAIDPFAEEFVGLTLVVADEGNWRVVVLTDMSATGWRKLDLLDDDGNQIEFEARTARIADRGRLLLVGYCPEQGRDGAYLVDADGAIIDWLDLGHVSESIAVDRRCGFVYFSSTSQESALTRLELATGVQTDFTFNTDWVYAIAADRYGFLYIAHEQYDGGAYTYRIDKFDTYSQSVVATFEGDADLPLGDGLWPEALSVIGDTLYTVSPWASADGEFLIAALDRNLQPLGAFGTIYSGGGGGAAPGEFYGPYQFVPTNSARIVVADGGYDDGEQLDISRIVMFNDISGAGWTTFGEHGSGVGQFHFYGGGGT